MLVVGWRWSPTTGSRSCCNGTMSSERSEAEEGVGGGRVKAPRTQWKGMKLAPG